MALFSINLQTGTIADEPEKDIIVGIDLGTTNSLVAVMRDGHPDVWPIKTVKTR